MKPRRKKSWNWPFPGKEFELKKKGILNSGVNSVLGALRHGDLLVISDAGLPVPEGIQVIDLAIEKDYPELVRMLKLITEEFIYEKVVVAAEQKENNPLLYSSISSIIKKCPITLEKHEVLLKELLPKARFVIRTGSFEPWGNILLWSGLNAPVWFSKNGVKVPESYQRILEQFEEQ